MSTAPRADALKLSDCATTLEEARGVIDRQQALIAELRREKARLESNYYDVADAITSESSGVEDLCKQARELRKDKARLDWLLCEGTREIITPTTRAKKIVLAYVKDEAETYRAAIDAAMEGDK